MAGRTANCCDSGLVDQLKALAHPVRMGIVAHLLTGGQCCCGEICACMPLAQSTVSQHLDLLKKAGLVNLVPDGTRSLYSVDQGALASIASQLGQLAATADSHAQSSRTNGRAS